MTDITTSPALPVVQDDPFSVDILRDPYPFLPWTAIRRAGGLAGAPRHLCDRTPYRSGHRAFAMGPVHQRGRRGHGRHSKAGQLAAGQRDPGSGSARAHHQAEDEGKLHKGFAANLARSFLRGGMDTTISGIGAALHALARDPDQWALLRSDPALARSAFDEAIRFEAPVQVMFRTTREGAELGGVALQPDTKIAAFIASANRDQDQWPDADRFDLRRQGAGQHLAFGQGAHVCIGQMIARLEAECLLGALARRVKRLALAGPPVLRPVNTLRTLDRLPLVVEAA